MKNYFKIGICLGLFAALFAVSCQREEHDIYVSPEALNKSSELSGLLRRVTDSVSNNILDSASCYKIKLPVETTVNGQFLLVSNEDGYQVVADIFNQSDTDQDHIEFGFPITIVYDNGQEIIVPNQEVLDGLAAQCPATPGSTPIGCFTILYPLTVSVYDPNFQNQFIVTINGDFDFLAFLVNLPPGQFYAVNYPVSAVNASGNTITIHNNAEFLAAILTAITDCNPVVTPCPNPHILTDGLIIYMPFGNEARDLISLENAVANFTPAYVNDRSGHSTCAISFNGMPDEFLKIPVTDNNQLQAGDSLTVSLWFKMQNTNPSNLEYLFEKSEGGFNQMLTLAVYDGNSPLFINQFGNTYNLWDNSWIADSSLHTDTTNWHHLVLTIEGDTNTVKLYRDGILRNTDANSGLMLGSEFFDYYLGRNFKGCLDDLRVYRRTLSQAEITTLFNLEGDCNTCIN
ncbi:MAG TPA: LamG domain-containing protein [Flavobacterium sp.]|nr:LamG domain-containing protein [Flavobacterium sp.]